MRSTTYQHPIASDFHRILCATLLLMSCFFATFAYGKDQQLHGVWQSKGYGYIFDFSGAQARVYDITSKSCMLNHRITLAIRHYVERDEQFVFTKDGMNFTPPLEKHPIQFDQIKAVPFSCTQTVAGTPQNVFEAFADYFDQHYAFFDLHGVNWSQRVDQFRSRVRDDMSEIELYDLLKELVSTLRDGHISISAEIDGEDYEFDAYPGDVSLAIDKHAQATGADQEELLEQLLHQYWIDNISEDLLAGDGELTGNGYIQYGMIDNIGYMSFLTAGGYAGKNEFHEHEDLEALNMILDKALALFDQNDAKAVIIDLSFNFGGYDFVGREIAARFAKQPTIAYYKRTGDRVGAIDTPISIEPHEGTRFDGPAYVVTTSQSVSAAEITTLSLRALPHIVHVGQRTAGALSDTLNKQLPNGWNITLSNEVYTDPDRTIWEGQGIKPDFDMTIFENDNPVETHNKAIKSMVALIQSGNL